MTSPCLTPRSSPTLYITYVKPSSDTTTPKTFVIYFLVHTSPATPILQRFAYQLAS
ncbi:hypothetical protein VCRA2130O400_280023 [Vibrio crassostreae]|nr:hypothetical protein VCRA2119O385_50105 [Vibrio crassostreae]CAK3326921.1 hypothetical protein VCRA2120O58_150002 [Vibrio crassostreae]CAK3731004.1 hypothetical protein VCRA217O17_160105 [Vibrio crassostreae]CAK3893612.1 hypothetical protein VCRA2130O400_280023 [Vibrio crassostreae]